MPKNATDDLMETASVISKGLHRDETFRKDSQGCPQCPQLWDQMRRHDEQQLQQLLPHIEHHLEQDEGLRRTAA